MCSSWASLKRSSPSILRTILIQRTQHRPFSNVARASSSSSSYGESSSDGKISGPLIEAFLVSVSGLIAGSSLGFWFSSSNESSFCFADWAATATEDPQKHFELHEKRQQKKSKFLFNDEYRRRVFFNYEKRIRLRSPPEKVFEYFSSIRTPKGEIFMTPADLMRAIVPVFPPSETNIVREGYLRGERPPGELHCDPSTFFMLFDTNSDGIISFPEYIFFVTLLSIPESSFSVAFKMFDQTNNGEIDREEFKKLMALMRTNHRQGVHHRDGRRTGFKVGSSVENGGLLEYFFGKDGNECLQHGKFVEFMRDFHDEILRLEFAHYDYKLRGTISAKDFALSIVASADINHINKFLNRVDELNNNPRLKDMRITWEEFKAFAELRKKLHPLALAIFSYGKVNGLLTKNDFLRAASHVCGVPLTDNVIDVIFHIFDANRDGSLSLDEFLGVLHRRERDIIQPTETGVVGFISCCLKSAKTCSVVQMFL